MPQEHHLRADPSAAEPGQPQSHAGSPPSAAPVPQPPSPASPSSAGRPHTRVSVSSSIPQAPSSIASATVTAAEDAIAVLILCYNRADYLKRTLASVSRCSSDCLGVLCIAVS